MEWGFDGLTGKIGAVVGGPGDIEAVFLQGVVELIEDGGLGLEPLGAEGVFG